MNLPDTRASAAILAVAALFVLSPFAAEAQIRDTGALVVRAVGPDRAPLAGVLVTVEGPLATRTERTGANGTTRLPGLAPGTYKAILTKDGFRDVERNALRVSVGRNVEITVAMSLASVEETVTISGQSPVVDVRSTSIGSVYSEDMIDSAPTSSGLWAGVLDHVPGVVSSNIDVGGSDSGQQSAFSARGGSSTQNVYSLNGANTTDPAALGASSMYYSISSFEEVGVTTGAHDVEVQSPGVVLNMVSKTGSNEWSASAKLFYENEAWIASNVDDAQRARGAGEGNANTGLGDFDMQLGGPIVRDRAWFFLDYWAFSVERLIVGLPPGEIDDTTLKNWTANVIVQLAPNHRLIGRLFTDGKVRNNRNAGNGVPPESAWRQDSFVLIPQFQYQGVLRSDTFLDLRFSYMDMDFPLTAKTDHPDFAGDVLPPSIERSTGALLPGSPPALQARYLRDNADVSGNLSYYITGTNRSHDIKVGGNFSRVSSFSPESWGYIWGFEQQFFNGAPERVRFWNHSGVDVLAAAQPDGPWIRGAALGLYAQDSLTFGNRLTTTLGLRFDASGSSIPAQCRGDSLLAALGPMYQAACTTGINDATSWRDLVPRLGIIYDLFGNGRTAVKANYSRYSNQQGVLWGDFLNPNGVGNQLYAWTDDNGDGLFSLGEQDELLRSFFPGATTSIDADLQSPLADEFSAGIDHELVPGFLISGTVIYRRDASFVEDVNTGVPYGPVAEQLGVPDAYTPVTVTEPGPDGIVGTADDGGPMIIYDQDPATFGDAHYFLTNPASSFGIDSLSNEYFGLSLVAHKRFSNNWQLMASWDVGRAAGTYDGGGAGGAGSLLDNPNDDLNRDGRTVWDRTHVVRVTGNYLFEGIGVNLGAFLRAQTGEPLIRRAILPAPVGVGGPPQVAINQVPVETRVEPRGEHRNPASRERLDPVTVLDLRAEKQFVVGRWGLLHVYADLFNLFNTNTVTAIEVDSSSAYDNIFRLVSPRVFRLGFGWEF